MPFMVLEHVPGVSLDRLISDKGLPDVLTAVQIFIQVADALGHGHKEGIFHRDIKASNVLVMSDGEGNCKVQIIDFGVAAMIGDGRQTHSFQGRTLVGTPKYMPPDQVSGVYDARSEIYSFGCLMYELLTGRTPFDSDDMLELLTKHANEPVPSFDEVCDHSQTLPAELEALVMKCLEKNPAERFQDMAGLRSELEAIERQLQSQQALQKAQESLSLFVDETVEESSPIIRRKSKSPFLVTAAVMVIVVIGTLLMFVNRSVAEKSSTLPKLAKRDAKQAVENAFGHYEEQQWFATATGVYQARPEVFGQITDESCRQLADKNVTSIVIPYSSALTGSGLEVLGEKPLTLIEITSPAITDEGLKVFSQFRTLTQLKLSLVPHLTSEALLRFVDLPRLQEVALCNCRVPADTVAILARIRTLKMVRLIRVKGTSKQDLELLATMPNLEALVIEGPNMKDVIPIMAKCRRLKVVAASAPDLTDDLVKPLVSTHIQILNLSTSSITGKGLLKLADMKNLKSLWI
ncbi:MAG: serine/threonine protein kinase, partial [Cyanobacteria bacterium]|nr:serine/threonine protein kinase [Cyanobacteriota bacterium]